MEIIQEIGSYAGIAAILGLAILSALYFSQARDVRRLREWAGRAPDRSPSLAVPAPAQPRGVVAEPISPRPAPSRPVPGGTPPPVPRPPGAQPATPAAASAAGAAPAVAHGPKLEGEEEDDADVTSMDTVIHPPPEPLEGDEGDDGEPEEGGDRDAGEQDRDWDEAGDRAAVPVGDDTGEWDPEDDPGDETGEWSPEHEHSRFDPDDDFDDPSPATPIPRPPTPPAPYRRRGGPAPATGYAARERGEPILPPYGESRAPSAGGAANGGSRDTGGRRRLLAVLAGAVAIVVVVFGVLQLTGGDESGDGGGAGLSSTDTTGDGSGAGGAGSSGEPIVPAEVTVAVLNGTTVPGLAATLGDSLRTEGFQLGTVTNNFDQERAESVVLYAPGSEREAADVARRLDVPQREPVDAESQALAGDASVIVVAGADQNQ